MKHSIWAALATGWLGLLSVGLFVFFMRPDMLWLDPRPQLCAETVCFMVDIADTPTKLRDGLMYRTSLGKKEWMLFVFDKAKKANFWMKNTLIPLDIVRLGSWFEVLHYVSAEPCRMQDCPLYAYTWLASYGLELNAGTMERYDITIGKKLQKK